MEGFGIINDLNSLSSTMEELIPGYVRDFEEVFDSNPTTVRKK